MSKNLLFVFLCINMISCNSDSEIKDLLNSRDKDSVIEGARKAGKTGKKEFIPMLLNSAADWRTSTNFSFKGVSVYQAKMEALRNIFKKEPPIKITDEPDSTIIKFYTDLYNKEFKNRK